MSPRFLRRWLSRPGEEADPATPPFLLAGIPSHSELATRRDLAALPLQVEDSARGGSTFRSPFALGPSEFTGVSIPPDQSVLAPFDPQGAPTVGSAGARFAPRPTVWSVGHHRRRVVKKRFSTAPRSFALSTRSPVLKQSPLYTLSLTLVPRTPLPLSTLRLLPPSLALKATLPFIAFPLLPFA